MLRARTNMEKFGYELEVDEFVRKELSIAGKKRTTNVWMDYVKEQTIAEEQQEHRQQQTQYAIRELRDLKRQHTAILDQKDQATLAQDDWNDAMAFTLSDDDNASNGIACHTPNRSKRSNRSTQHNTPKRTTTQYTTTNSTNYSTAHHLPATSTTTTFTTTTKDALLVRSQSAPVVTQHVPKDSGVWPPLNEKSPWTNVATQSVKGKGSCRLIDATSYEFPYWTRNLNSLPPVTTECRDKLITRIRTSDGTRMAPPNLREERRKKDLARKTFKKKKKLWNFMYRDPNDKRAEQSRAQRLYEADNECSEAANPNVEHIDETNEKERIRLEKKDKGLDEDSDDEGDDTGNGVMAGWVKFMEQHQQKKREKYLEDGKSPLPPSALIRGRQVVDKQFVPSEPSKRLALRLEQDVMKNCTDPSKILPIPTLNRKQYKQVLDYMGKELLIRQNLKGMEREERERRVFLKQEKRYLRSLQSGMDEEKARLAMLRFLKRAMVLSFKQWSEYTLRMNKARRFMRKILMGKQTWVFDTIKDLCTQCKQVKRHGFTKLQANTRTFVQHKKYGRLIVDARAQKCIRKAWHAYCARNLLARMVKKREETENKIKMLCKRIMFSFVIKVIAGWREQTKIARFANMMAGGNVRKRKKELLTRWRR